MTGQELLLAMMPSILVGIFMAVFNSRQKKREERAEEKEKLREEADACRLSLLLATAKLSYAVAMAMKRGKPNGEIEEGIEQYEKAKERFREFERKLVTKV